METGRVYHLFNHANGWEDMFREAGDYHLFIYKMSEHLTPWVEIQAFCLMSNHFHLAVRIPGLQELRGIDARHASLSEGEMIRLVTKRFSNLFSCYTLRTNLRHGRTGSLFCPNMKVREVDDEASFCRVVFYIHANPLHHGFARRMDEWPYSSFPVYKAMKWEERERNPVLRAFGGYDSFMRYHEQPVELKLSDAAEERRLLRMTAKKRADKRKSR